MELRKVGGSEGKKDCDTQVSRPAAAVWETHKMIIGQTVAGGTLGSDRRATVKASPNSARNDQRCVSQIREVVKLKGMAEALDRSFSARLDCHYLLQTPEQIDQRTPLVVTLHGFGGSPESMLKMTDRLFEARPVIAAIQGPYQFFLSTAAREVGYGWITNRRSAESIRLHHEMVLHVLEEVGSEFRIPKDRRVLVGFSQAVALNYRFASSCPEAIRGVIAICGGLPGDWDRGPDHPIRASVLHIAARQDEYYPPSVTEYYTDKLRQHASAAEFRLIDGGHRMPSTGAAIVSPWLRQILSSCEG